MQYLLNFGLQLVIKLNYFYIKNGIYKEKLVIPSWVKNVQLVGEDAEKTIITYDDHANINKMGTFRTDARQCSAVQWKTAISRLQVMHRWT